MMPALYSVGTWDTDENAYTPHHDIPAFNLTLSQLLGSLRAIRKCGYSAHRGGPDARDDNDWAVLVERTDGMSEAEIRKQWKRRM